MTVSFCSIRRFDGCGLALVAALAWSRPSLAQSQSQSQPRSTAAKSTNPEAQARFDAGVAAYEEGRYRDAIERFKEADELAPSALLSFNVAKVYERMADGRNALASYRAYLRRLPHADNRRAVEERIGALEQALKASGVQQVTILSTPPGATVAIDNVSRGVTPWTGELIPGPHTLSVRLVGYREAVSEIELSPEHAIDIETPLVAGAEPAPAAAIEAAASVAEASKTPAPVPAPAPAELTSPAPRWWTWAMFGGSAAAFIGAGAFELSRGHLEDDARQSQVQVDYEQKFDAMESRQTAARVFLGLGFVAAIAGGVSLYFDLQTASERPPSVAFDCTHAGCTLATGGRF